MNQKKQSSRRRFTPIRDRFTPIEYNNFRFEQFIKMLEPKEQYAIHYLIITLNESKNPNKKEVLDNGLFISPSRIQAVYDTSPFQSKLVLEGFFSLASKFTKDYLLEDVNYEKHIRFVSHIEMSKNKYPERLIRVFINPTYYDRIIECKVLKDPTHLYPLVDLKIKNNKASLLFGFLCESLEQHLSKITEEEREINLSYSLESLLCLLKLPKSTSARQFKLKTLNTLLTLINQRTVLLVTCEIKGEETIFFTLSKANGDTFKPQETYVEGFWAKKPYKLTK